MVNYIFGLGGRDSSPRDLRRIFEDLIRIAKTGQVGKGSALFRIKGVGGNKNDNSRMEIYS